MFLLKRFSPFAPALLALACGASEPAPEPLAELPEDALHTARECGVCHKSIHSAWKVSLHAAAATDPLFRASMEQAVELRGEQARRMCLKCHAPAVLINEDYALRHQSTRDGVSCAFCHSIKGVDLARQGHPFELETGPVMLGPIKDAHSTGHEVAYSELFEESLHCAGCHQETNEKGVEVLATYREWEDYAAKGGDKTCQNCHMPQVAAMIVDPKVKRVEGGFVNLHSMPGGHSMDQLNKSLRVAITQLKPTSDGIFARVQVKNVGAGHKVPTGMPTRKIILRMEAVGEDGSSDSAETVFERVLTDESGQEIVLDARVFSQAAAQAADTRLAPMEEREVEFRLDVPPSQNITATATLIYYYSPLNDSGTEKRFAFASDSKQLTVHLQRAGRR